MQISSTAATTTALCAALALLLAPVQADAGKKKKKGSEVVVLGVLDLNKDTKIKQVRALEKRVKRVPGVRFVTASRKNGELKVRVKLGMDIKLVHAAVQKAGFKVMMNDAGVAPPVDEDAGDDAGDDAGADVGAGSEEDIP